MGLPCCPLFVLSDEISEMWRDCSHSANFVFQHLDFGIGSGRNDGLADMGRAED